MSICFFRRNLAELRSGGYKSTDQALSCRSSRTIPIAVSVGGVLVRGKKSPLCCCETILRSQ